MRKRELVALFLVFSVSRATVLQFVIVVFLIILTNNFDKDHYTDLHRVQCSEHTPLAINKFRSFFFKFNETFSFN